MDKKLQETLEEITKLLAVLVKKGSMQSSLIRDLDAVGFKPKRIAELIGTTPNAVRVALYHVKKSRNKKSKK